MKHHEDSNTLAQERTLLAAERTFSAWLNTALGAMAGGLAILRLLIFKTIFHKILAHIIGNMLIMWGMLLIVFAAIDYKKIAHALPKTTSYKGSVIGFYIIIIPLLVMSLLLLLIIVG